MFVGGTKDDLIDKTGGGSGGGDSPSSPSPKNGSSSGPVSKEGLSKGVSPDDIDTEQFFEARDGELSDDVDVADLGYGIPLLVMDLGGKNTGKTSDWASDEIPRPVADEKTTIITCGHEAKTGIINRWGGVPEFVDIINIGKVWDRSDPETASIAIAGAEKVLNDIIENGGTCNLIIDDIEKMYDELLRDKCRHEFGWAPGEIKFTDESTSFWTRRKELGRMLVDKFQKAAKHLLVMSGYDETVVKDMEKVDGQMQLVKKVEDPRWVEPFEKPFDVKLLRDTGKVESEEGETEREIWTCEVVGASKVSRLFPTGARYDVTDVGVAKFWNQLQAQKEQGDTMADAAKETDN